MNIVHLKYAVEVAKTRSISKAAENLYMGQPNLSRAIKDLEESIGISIFNRNTKGITVTSQGEEFLKHAEKILAQIDEVEQIYKEAGEKKQKFSISVPRATYISEAFCEFAKSMDKSLPAEFVYKETNSVRAIRNIIQSDYNLGIIRYQSIYEQQFAKNIEEKGLESELIAEFKYSVCMSKDHPLAKKDLLEKEDFLEYTEVAHADPYVPTLPITDIAKQELLGEISKRIFVFERGSQFELLEKVPNTFMLVSPVPQEILDKYHLVEKQLADNNKIYRDMLIFKKGYRFSDLDNRFITEVCNSKRKFFKM